MTLFTNTGELNHNSTISGLQDGQTNNYYLKCQNADNASEITDDFKIHFFILDYLLEQCFPDQLAYWTFDNFNNDTLYDVLGSNYGDINCDSTTTTGVVGEGYNFNGDDCYIEVDDVGLDDNSIGFWITPNQDYGIGSGQTEPVVLFRDGLTDIYIDTDGSLKESNDGDVITTTQGKSWNIGESYYVVNTPGSSGNFYVNGVIDEVLCGDDSGIAWDSVTSAETIARSDSASVAITDSVGYGFPYAWSVSGTGFTLDNAQTDGLTNTLNADASACGTATITVTGCDGTVVTGEVRCTTGKWVTHTTCANFASCGSGCGNGGCAGTVGNKLKYQISYCVQNNINNCIYCSLTPQTCPDYGGCVTGAGADCSVRASVLCEWVCGDDPRANCSF